MRTELKSESKHFNKSGETLMESITSKRKSMPDILQEYDILGEQPVRLRCQTSAGEKQRLDHRGSARPRAFVHTQSNPALCDP